MDYAELIAEVTERSGMTSVANRASQYVGMAERALSRALRVSEMETETTLTTDSNGDVSLPGDFQEMRSIRAQDRILDPRPLSRILSGHSVGYAVQGGTLKSYYADTGHEVVYYAALPGLDVNDTNWLLDSDPEIYIQAVLLQVWLADAGKNPESLQKATLTRSYLTDLVAARQSEDHMKRRAGTRVYIGDLTA